MPIPLPIELPIDIVASALPMGFKGDLEQTHQAFADALSAQISPTFLTGKTTLAKDSEPAPTSDFGPWANGNEWWFWDPATGQYEPSNQGSPVGTIFLFGGMNVPINGNWLLCVGQAVSRSLYSRLFQAIGETWGPGDGQSTFNLPPAAKIFVNAPGWIADVSVPTDPKGDGTFYLAQGVNARGGQQSTKLFGAQIPPLQTKIPWINPSFTPATAAYNIPNIQPPGVGAPDQTVYPVKDTSGGVLGANQKNVPTMPPYVAVNHIIKWR